MNYKQLIIVRSDLNMSPGKMSAQVAHGSNAFLLNQILEKTDKVIFLEHKKKGL